MMKKDNFNQSWEFFAVSVVAYHQLLFKLFYAVL